MCSLPVIVRLVSIGDADGTDCAPFERLCAIGVLAESGLHHNCQPRVVRVDAFRRIVVPQLGVGGRQPLRMQSCGSRRECFQPRP